MSKLLAVLLLSVSLPAHAILACVNGQIGFNWNVGQPLPALDVADITALSCYANGEEYEYIYSRFENVPHVIRQTQVLWRGENARFVLDNLTLDLK